MCPVWTEPPKSPDYMQEKPQTIVSPLIQPDHQFVLQGWPFQYHIQTPFDKPLALSCNSGLEHWQGQTSNNICKHNTITCTNSTRETDTCTMPSQAYQGQTMGVSPLWRVLFDACLSDAIQLGASHFDAMPDWRATVWRVFQFDAWQFGAGPITGGRAEMQGGGVKYPASHVIQQGVISANPGRSRPEHPSFLYHKIHLSDMWPYCNYCHLEVRMSPPPPWSLSHREILRTFYIPRYLPSQDERTWDCSHIPVKLFTFSKFIQF